MSSLLLLGVLFLLFALNVPIAFALMGVALFGFIVLDVASLQELPQQLVGGMSSFILLAVPFFILAGLLMNYGGVTHQIFGLAGNLVGHIRGGLGHVNVLASIIFAGKSGAAQADAAGLGLIQIEGMKREGFDPDFAAAITATSATIGAIIPPSIILVVYGALAQTSIGAVLVAGILPGLLMGLALMLMVYLIARRRNYPVDERATFKAIVRSFLRSVVALFAPVILIGGIFLGIFTPTEAGAVAAAYALVISAFFYKGLKWHHAPQILTQLVVATAGIMLIIGAARPMGYVIARERIPQQAISFLPAEPGSGWMLLLIIVGIILIAGMFLEGLAVLAILVPILLPATQVAGIDPVHLGIVICMTLMIGTITPPVGVVAYIVCSIADISYPRLLKAAWPFMLALFVALMAVVFIPDLSLLIPSLMF